MLDEREQHIIINDVLKAGEKGVKTSALAFVVWKEKNPTDVIEFLRTQTDFVYVKVDDTWHYYPKKNSRKHVSAPAPASNNNRITSSAPTNKKPKPVTPTNNTEQASGNQSSEKVNYTEDLKSIVKDAVNKERLAKSESISIASRQCVKQIDMRVNDRNTSLVYDKTEGKVVYWITENPVKQPHRGCDYFVYRNCDIARILQKTAVAENYELKVRGAGISAGSLFIHDGHIYNAVDYKRHSIQIDGIDGEQRFSELSRLLDKLREQETTGKAPQLSGREMLQSFLHDSAQLGFTPILRGKQAEAKYDYLFSSSVIIEGGPGTGKTTTVISRLKYLTDQHEIQKDIDGDGDTYAPLKTTAKRKLLELIRNNKDWVFFTPSVLLKQYMASAMEKEGLSDAYGKVCCWENFLSLYLSELGLFDTHDARPKFRAKDVKDDVLMNNPKRIIIDFIDYYTKSCIRVDRLSLNGLPTELQERAKLIKESIENAQESQLDDVIRLFRQLETDHGTFCSRELEILKKNVDNVAKVLLESVNNDSSAIEYIRENIKKSSNKEEDTDDIDDSVEEQDKPRNEAQRVQAFVRGLIEPFSLWMCHSKKPQAKTKIAHFERFEPLLLGIDTETLQTIADRSLFRPFANLTLGIKANVLKGISKVYKDYRKGVLSQLSSNWNIDLLKELIGKDNRDLHIQEQALLVGAINYLSRKVLKIDSRIEHPYIDCLKNYERPIVGIDEATDFSVMEIFAMTTFAIPEYSSITLDGDIMQRITDRGIQSWDELRGILANEHRYSLTTSYRQSAKMLRVAQQLYKDATGTMPNYTADIQLPSVPEPLAYVNKSEESKIEWIEENIHQIYDIYNNRLPSIAIFLNDHEMVYDFSRKLGAQDFFRENGIQVIVGSEGETLAKPNQVRVFSIDKVKGMEFDAVFFHNVDQSPYPQDLIMRYIYVGVSRAAFFLGITMQERKEELLKYFNEKANWACLE